MRIMVDTNVLVSALLFPRSVVGRVLEAIALQHTLVLSSFVVDELRAVVARKFPDRMETVERMLERMSYEMVYTPRNIDEGMFEIRDPKDYPVLYTAMINGVDILVTGDKDFASVEVEAPQIMTPADYLSKVRKEG